MKMKFVRVPKHQGFYLVIPQPEMPSYAPGMPLLIETGGQVISR